jgi:HSP20 family protein
MTLIRRVNNNYPTFRNWMDDFMGTVDNSVNFWNTENVPAVNIAESDDNFKIEFAAPGLTKADFKINLDNDVLIVKSEKEVNEEESKTNYTRKEFNFSSFQRTFTLPDSADGERIMAEYKEGILSIDIPKKEEAKVKPARDIEIA